MSDQNLADKINHIEKIVVKIETVLHNQSEKFAESVRHNSVTLNEHDNRLTLMEKNYHLFQGSIATLNRLLSLFGGLVIAGAVWIFGQVNDLRHYQEMDRERTIAELKEVKQELTRLDKEIKKVEQENERLHQLSNTH